MAQHVPAWKKLGLKLKYAKDTAENASPNVQPSTTPEDPEIDPAVHRSDQGTKRSHGEVVQDQDGSSKKRKKSNPTTEDRHITPSKPASNGLGIQLDGTSLAKTGDSAASSPPSEEKPPRRKCVTFTPETKEEDGFSAGEYFKVWSGKQQQPHTPPRSSTEIVLDMPTTVEAPKEPEVPPEDIQSSPKERAKSKDKNPREKRKDKQKAAPTAAYLDYLDQFHTDKSKWKFNKAKQNDLLRNVWNIYRIPSSYNEALLAYIHGLQGVNARQRLGEAAQEILESAPQSTSGDASAEVAAEQRQQAEKRIRAELIVKQLQSWSIPPPLSVSTQRAANGEAKHMKFAEDLPAPISNGAKATPTKRSRKSRTAASDSSSSESSSSESSSESDSSESSDSNSESESEESSSSSESEDSNS